MEKESRLLNYSLKQIKGVGPAKEREHWKSGNGTLQAVADATAGEERCDCDAIASIEALDREDWEFFLSHLPHSDFYRVAYSVPESVMFLDVETTGLSPAYSYLTMAGWLKDGKYGYWLAGTDPQEFLDTFASAPLIITYNGIRFDCRFLDATFETSDFSAKPNLDLMYLGKTHGLRGGQKSIEDMVGFERPKAVRGADGVDAVRNWRKFLRGSDAALHELLAYNRCDMYGMAAILDHIFFEKIYGHVFPKVGNPKRFHDPDAVFRDDLALPDKATRELIRSEVR